jgi:MerR family mercuric resistance operon transcriptional regulator
MHAEIAIGELSRRTECNIETIRYYERIGLLPPAHRPGGRFRRYDADDVARLRFIRRARQLGFTLDEVRAFMRLAGTEGDDVCAEARRLAAAHVAGIRAGCSCCHNFARWAALCRHTRCLQIVWWPLASWKRARMAG